MSRPRRFLDQLKIDLAEKILNGKVNNITPSLSESAGAMVQILMSWYGYVGRNTMTTIQQATWAQCLRINNNMY